MAAGDAAESIRIGEWGRTRREAVQFTASRSDTSHPRVRRSGDVDDVPAEAGLEVLRSTASGQVPGRADYA